MLFEDHKVSTQLFMESKNKLSCYYAEHNKFWRAQTNTDSLSETTWLVFCFSLIILFSLHLIRNFLYQPIPELNPSTSHFQLQGIFFSNIAYFAQSRNILLIRYKVPTNRFSVKYYLLSKIVFLLSRVLLLLRGQMFY